MARSIVLGNGNSLVCLDGFGQVRDFYFPFVGQENHIGSFQVHKVGVFVDGRMDWLDSPAWKVSLAYKGNSMVSGINASHQSGILLESEDAMYNEKNIFVRKITIKNNSKFTKKLKLFLNQQFKIGDTNHADTAYFSSAIESVVHYKGRRVFLIGGVCDKKPFDDYSIGFVGVEGKEGTWKDADDGVLSKNSIEHGAVDSVIAWEREVEPGNHFEVYYWIAAGETYKQVTEMLEYVLEKTPEHLIESTKSFWSAWIMQANRNFYNISPNVQELFYKSLLVIRAHTDNRGGIIASADSGNVQYGGDTYGYIWPRDAAFTALSYDLSGFTDISRHFYSFCNEVITKHGYMLHKYQPDRSLGSSWHPWVKDGKRQLAIQEDETAVLLYGLWEHYIRAKDLEFIEKIYNSFIKLGADFLSRYRSVDTKLPLPSYDLWEEKYCVSPFTSSIVYAGLTAAGNFAKTLGKTEDAERYYKDAEEVRKAILSILWDDNRKIFKKLAESDSGLVDDFNVDASSFFGVFKFGVCAVDDERLKQNFEVTKSALTLNTGIGGVARYINDRYLKSAENIPGNPWFITTLWLTQYRIANAKNMEELNFAITDLEWVVKNKTDSGLLPEQLNPFDGSPLSVTPLVWSHSEFVRTVIEYTKKAEVFNSKLKFT